MSSEELFQFRFRWTTSGEPKRPTLWGFGVMANLKPGLSGAEWPRPGKLLGLWPGRARDHWRNLLCVIRVDSRPFAVSICVIPACAGM